MFPDTAPSPAEAGVAPSLNAEGTAPSEAPPLDGDGATDDGALATATAATHIGVLCMRDITFSVALFAGPRSLHHLIVLCRPATVTVRCVWKAVVDQFPARIYVCGGIHEQRLRSAARLSLAWGAWEGVMPMAQSRGAASAAVIGGKLYVCGGCEEMDAVMRLVERFDPKVGSWEAMPPMLVAREGAAAGAIDGKLYICGGSGFGEMFSSAERFDPVTNSWEMLPSLSEPRAWSGAGTVVAPGGDCAGARLYVCGGQNRHDPLSSAEYFDTVAGAWCGAPEMAEQRSAPAAATIGSVLYICGGWDHDRIDLQSVERLDTARSDGGEWEAVEPMSVARFGAAAATAAGRLHVFGGCNDEDMYLNSAEEFDPTTGTWSPLPPMAERRTGAAVVATSA